ncbi:MAG TPA: nitrous oxide reductase family maturation protein NosD [Leptospiraceae bacterium]|nr:nitrous oxide reductase family maturation protein NosD [Leptospiraceae bacterium]HMW06373.1 nitrous oxide reductase family maturation protein NosD [Leptospiraceae bacterium]HMX31715.1 nitrous oxide reductase family maturation protein NosD [Leptospiraceae bacterium]HMY32001.1 nitrous oxide reductase family maturation protein NosD [Leptospiraceae bacterium]HMZ65786.1 nitrous oxide reductase family maturation protein NosD [Leptospiraceae bacterium]
MKPNRILFTILYLTLSSCIYDLNAKTLNVCNSCEWKTIQDALNAATTGDTVEVEEGTFKESPIQIKKSVKLIGINFPTIDGNNKESVIDITADSVEVSGFKIINGGISDIHEFAGIHIENSKNCLIHDNHLENNAYGIYLAKVQNCRIENNDSIGNAVNEVSGGNGVHIWSCENIQVIKNKTSMHRDGIYIEFSNSLVIEENYSTESIRYGLHFMFSNDNKFIKNHFTRNSTGVAIMYSKNIEILENFFEKSKDSNSYGILLKDISDSNFKNNIFQENTIGITADNATRNNFIHNTFKKNGWAFNMMGNCDDNQLVENNFIENVFDLSTNSRENRNKYEKNFWDSYNGYDLDKNGFGDKPYLPVRFFSYWVNVYPFLMVLFQSPIIEFLEIAERAFPVMTPVDLKDNFPQIKKIAL